MGCIGTFEENDRSLRYKQITKKACQQLNLNMSIYSRKNASNYSTSSSFGRDITNMCHNRKNGTIKRKPKKACQSWMKGLPQMIPYEEELSLCARKKGEESYIKEGYMEKNLRINCGMRETLVGWMIQIYSSLRIKKETLFLAVFILDRFCSKREISKERYQLLGVTSLFVAAKYEEVKTPKLKQYGTFVSGVYWVHQILDMQSQILLALSFQIRVMTSVDYLVECLQIVEAEDKIAFFSHYLLELALIQYGFCLVNPLILSWAVICVSGSKLRENCWETKVIQNSGIEQNDMRIVAREVQRLFEQRNERKFLEVNKRYSKELSQILL